MVCKNMKKNRTLPKNEFNPNNENIATKKCGFPMYLTKMTKRTEKTNAIIDVTLEIFFLSRIFSKMTDF